MKHINNLCQVKIAKHYVLSNLIYFLMISFIIPINFEVKGQNILLSSINSSGQSGKFSYTVGEIVVKLKNENTGQETSQSFINSSSIVHMTTARDEKEQKITVNFFPNPVSTYLNIELTEGLSENFIVEVLDLNSKIVYSQQFSGLTKSMKINTLQWALGNYIVRILKNNVILTSTKIIKK